MRLDTALLEGDRDRGSLTHIEARRPAPAPARATGLVRFVPTGRGAAACDDLRARRFLCVTAQASPPPRGRLRAAIDDAVEVALAMRGALPPGVDPAAALDAVIADQLFRALALGAAGLAVVVPSLSAAAGDRGALGLIDSEAITAWLAATRDGPIALIFEERDRRARILAPTPLDFLTRGLGEVSIAAAEAVASDLGEALGAAAMCVEIDQAVVATRAPELPTPPVLPEPPVLSEPPVLPEPPALSVSSEQPALPEAPRDNAPKRDPRPRGVLLPRGGKARRPEAVPTTLPAQPAAPSAQAVMNEPADAADREEPRPPRREPSPGRVVDFAASRSLAMELDEARGPRPVRIIEQLFASHYVPLLEASLMGEADAAVRNVVDGWRTSFERSYRESFSALRVTGKRPPMVLDAPDLAARIGRINGARGVKLVLVDAMRYDLGERIAARLKDAMAGHSVLVERALLWAALPTTTTAQAALLARGPEGLREPPPSEPEPEIARGRAVGTLRRERIGNRELMKLDLVEARLRGSGPPFVERMDAIADEVTDVLQRFLESLPPRTLAFVFGDHGFRLSPIGDGPATGPATQGGSSPEEVLVPAQAWLVGGVH